MSFCRIAPVKRVDTQLLNWFRTGVEAAYYGKQLSCPCK